MKREKKYKKIRSKWVHGLGTLRVVKTETGYIRMRNDGVPNHACMTDHHVLDVFVWLGRYLAEKGKLPRHIALDQIAVATQRSSKDIRAIVAMETYALRAHKTGDAND